MGYLLLSLLMEWSSEEIESTLDKLTKEINSISEIDIPPKTTLQVLQRSNREIYWNQLLAYFIDPNESHGLNTDFFSILLEELPIETDELDTGGSESDYINVDTEVDCGEEGRVDVLVWLEKSWYICFENKVRSPERTGQTQAYVDSSTIGDLEKQDYNQENRYYVYLSHNNAAEPESTVFVDCSWETVARAIDQLLLSSQGIYPSQTRGQLRDFNYTIKREMGMMDQSNKEEINNLAKLYVENSETISRLREGFEAFHNKEEERWDTYFLNNFEPDTWGEEWNAERNRGKFFKDEWRTDIEGNPVTDPDQAEYRVAFQHFIWNKDNFVQGELKFRCLTTRYGNEEYRERFKTLWNEEYADQVRNAKQEFNFNNIGRIKTHAEKKYTFDPVSIPDGYYEKLTQAFDEFAVVAKIVDEINEEVLKEIT